MSEDQVTPADLERQLDVPAKRIRDILRAKYGLLVEHGATRWYLNDEQVDFVRRTVSRG